MKLLLCGTIEMKFWPSRNQIAIICFEIDGSNSQTFVNNQFWTYLPNWYTSPETLPLHKVVPHKFEVPQKFKNTFVVLCIYVALVSLAARSPDSYAEHCQFETDSLQKLNIVLHVKASGFSFISSHAKFEYSLTYS